MTTVNGKALLGAEIRENRIGAWTAELDVDAEDALSGAVTIDIDGVTWQGTVVRGDVEAGRFRAWVVGGKHGLSKRLSPRHYISSSMRLVLGELVAASGEVLAPTTDHTVLQKAFTRWSRGEGTVGAALSQVAADCKVSWRVLRDGTVWLGQETWLPNTVRYDEIDRSPNRGRITIAPDTPLVKPGDLLAMGKVSTVTTRLSDSGTRQDVLFEDTEVGGLDRVRQMITNAVESIVGRRIDYSNWYPARVVAQAADDTVDLYPDNERIRGQGISRVPLRHGLPGCSVRVKPGSRVTLYWEDNDPKKPAAGLWPDGSSVLEITISAETRLTLDADVRIQGDLQVTGEVTAKHGGVTPIALTTHVHQSAGAGSPSGPPEQPPAP